MMELEERADGWMFELEEGKRLQYEEGPGLRTKKGLGRQGRPESN
jgi:hypothetical protein